jgi:cellulose synthase/poly-beta-1,6-N-acetylglucosamine synthase-like glycosyltransferase
MTPAILVCIALTTYCFLGYPLLIALLSINRRQFHGPLPPLDRPTTPPLSIVLCVHNASAQIEHRLSNLFTCTSDSPIEIVVYCDGCTDDTVEKLQAWVPKGLRIHESTRQQGKAAGLNATIPICSAPIVILCDVRQTFAPDALGKLAAPFSDPAVSAVSGLLEIAPSASGSGRGVDLYWRLETKLREWEGRLDSVIGCTGAIYALRRDLFTPLPEDTLLDDVVIPMQLAVAGGRILYEPTARAFDPQTLDPEREKRRKLRTLVGNFQMLERYPSWILPWKNRLWWQLLSHKYLRLLVPWLLIAIAILTAFATKTFLIAFLAIGQVTAYTLALVGLVFPGIRFRLLSVPTGFVLLQISCLAAFFAYLRHRKNYLTLWRSPSSSPFA